MTDSTDRAALPRGPQRPYTAADWNAECYIAFGEGRDPAPCPACDRTGFYGPRVAEPDERFRACRFCGFTQHVGRGAERYVATVHGCEFWPECAKAPYLWWVRATRSSYTCPYCAKKVAVASHRVTPPADDRHHPWWKVPQGRKRSYYLRFWENWPVTKGRAYL